MIELINNSNIALSNAMAIVNASNGIGWMGGRMCINKQYKGVAESIQYVSKGAVEKLAKAECKKHIFGYRPGSIFVTPAPNMNTEYIIHAVTMRLPGCKSHLRTIEQLVPKILELSEQLKVESVAIPLLGCGTGRLSEDKVCDIYYKYLMQSNIKYYIYKYSK